MWRYTLRTGTLLSPPPARRTVLVRTRPRRSWRPCEALFTAGPAQSGRCYSSATPSRAPGQSAIPAPAQTEPSQVPQPRHTQPGSGPVRNPILSTNLNPVYAPSPSLLLYCTIRDASAGPRPAAPGFECIQPRCSSVLAGRRKQVQYSRDAFCACTVTG